MPTPQVQKVQEAQPVQEDAQAHGEHEGEEEAQEARRGGEPLSLTPTLTPTSYETSPDRREIELLNQPMNEGLITSNPVPAELQRALQQV